MDERANLVTEGVKKEISHIVRTNRVGFFPLLLGICKASYGRKKLLLKLNDCDIKMKKVEGQRNKIFIRIFGSILHVLMLMLLSSFFSDLLN